jgi:predicted DNA-binding protein (UPF0251 family)
MDVSLPPNFKQLSASQQAIYAAEALWEGIDSNLSGDNATLRKRVREHFGIATSTAERAEKLQKLYPKIASEVKAGARSLPKSAEDWKALKTSTPAQEDQETNSSLDSRAPEKEEQRLNLALGSPSGSETPKPTPLLIPFEAPDGSPLEPHPLAALFPQMESDEFNKLVEDLIHRGLLTPIVVYEDKILDGRNRDRGCIEAKVTPRYVEYTGSDPLGFIVSANLHRRHLTTAQRAMIASKLATMKWGGERTSEEQRPNLALAPSEAASPTSIDITLEQAANRLQVSRASAVKARAIAKAAPEVADEVAAGKLSLNEAGKKAGVKGKAKPSKPAPAKKTATAPAKVVATAPASPAAKQNETLIARCEELLEMLHEDFPDFSLREIALNCGVAAERMMVRACGIAAKLDSIMEGTDETPGEEALCMKTCIS